MVDQTGRLLSSPETDSDTAMRDKMFEFSHRLEESYSNRIQEMLTPLVGPGRVRAQVVAQVDMTTTESTREQFNPQSQVVRSESRPKKPRAMEQARPVACPARSPISRRSPASRCRRAQRPPSRNPAPPRAAPAGATPNNADGTVVTGPDSTSRQTTRNYEIDRTMAYTRAPAGKVTRLSVAVLIDNLRTTAADGKVTESPLPPEQLERLTALVRDAVGFDATRGDTVNVVNSSFLGTPAIDEGELESIPFWERAWAQTLAKVLGRPRRVAGHHLQRAEAADQGPADRRPSVRVAPGGARGRGRRWLAAPAEAPGLAYEQQVAAARGMVAQDPKRGAQVVKAWVQSDA